MAPTKGIKTYSNKNKKPDSKLALDNLLANNMRKRLEISILHSSPEKSSESTFDRLLKGKVYNNVVFRKYADNNFYETENSASSIFSKTDNSFKENNQQNLVGSMQKSSLLSPVVILERNVDKLSSPNKKTETLKHHNPEKESSLSTSNYSINMSHSDSTENQEYCPKVNSLTSQLLSCQKGILMNTLELCETEKESTYFNFRNSVGSVSTPQNRNSIYRLRNYKQIKDISQELLDRVSYFSGGERNDSLHNHYQKLQSQIDELSRSRSGNIQGNSNIDSSCKGTFAEDFREASQISSNPLPVNDYSLQDQPSTSLLSESLKIINDWSDRCPTLNSFNSNIQEKTESKCISHRRGDKHRRKRDTKLFKKLRVILKRNPDLEKIITNHFGNMAIPNMKFVSGRKRNSYKKNTPNLKNCAVYLTPLKTNEKGTLVERPKVKDKSSKQFLSKMSGSTTCTSYSNLAKTKTESLKVLKARPSLESEHQIKYNPEIKDSFPIEVNTVVRNNFKHKCSAECEHFSRIPRVMLERCDFSKKIKSHKYSDINNITDSLYVDNSPKFRGFNADSIISIHDSVEHEKSLSQITKISARDLNYELGAEEDCSGKILQSNSGYSYVDNFPKFRGFNADSIISIHDSVEHEKSSSQIEGISTRDLNYDLETEEDCAGKILQTNSGQFKMKNCHVKLDQMIVDAVIDKDNTLPILKENEPKKNLSDCWVSLENINEGIESISSESVNSLQKDSAESDFYKPRTKRNSLEICLPKNRSLIDECDVFRETVKIREFVSLAPGKKFRRSIAIFKKSLDDLENILSSSQATLCRRQSIKLIPVLSNKNKISDLAGISSDNFGYVSLRQSLRRSSLEKVENYLPNVRPVENYFNYTKNTADQLTARDIVLKRCGQTEPITFEKCYPTSVLLNCQKIGEGVFGEVFLIRDKDGSTTVMKVIPIEGEQIVNLEKQKTFEEIISEIIISMELSNLERAKRNNTDAFVKVKRVRCVQGCYPDRLLELWELYDENKQSENDSPQIFLEDQLYIVIELENAGIDLEAFQFKNAQQALAVFEQITCALAVAENELQFEHRDLHWGNVLISPSEKKNTVFVLDGKEIIVNNRGAKATIIDFTLSRVEYDSVIIFNDLSMDEDLFTAKGDYQFDIYRKMQESNGNQWQSFKPYSNILWLHYILDKALKGFRYKNTKSKLHKTSIAILKSYEQIILEYNSTTDFVLNNFISNTLIE